MTQPHTSEETYELLISYRFVRRYVGGKSVADICWSGVGSGTPILAGSADSLTVLTRQPHDPGQATLAPNARVEEADLPKLPSRDGSFDLAIAFGVIEKLEDPDEMIREAKRVLKDYGLLVLSTRDKQAHSIDRNHRVPENRSEMYVPELRELLERHFERVKMLRLGSVAGGMVLSGEDLSATRIEAADFPSPLSSGSAIPTTLSVLAVCSDAEIPHDEDWRPYLFLDRERSVFEECEELREDVELLREEVRRVQETEVQAFEEALQLHGSENLSLRTQLKSCRERLEQLRERNERLEQRATNAEKLREHLNDIEGSRTWRLLNIYRRLMSWRKP